MRCMSTVGKRAGEGVLQAHHTASQHKQEREPSSCIGRWGQPPLIFRVIPGPMAVMYHPMPAPDPTLPLLSCCSHPPCHPASLQPSVPHGKESISLPLYHGLQQITGAKQIAVPDEKHHHRRAGAASITQGIAFSCVKRGRRQELQGWRLGALTLRSQPMMKLAQATSPLATDTRERCMVPQHLAILQQVPRDSQKHEGKMQAYLYKYKV